MPVLRRSGQADGPAAPPPSGLRLERITTYSFTAADSGARGLSDSDLGHFTALYGPEALGPWVADATAVNHHDMVRAIAEDLGPQLDGVDLVITVQASPDCLHQSFPGCVLGALLPGDPLVLGVSEQGVAGPFTALRTAAGLLATGAAHKALIVLLEQSSLPPGEVRPERDLAVALLLGTDLGAGQGIALGRPQVTVTGRLDAFDPDRTGPAPIDLPIDPDAQEAAELLVLGEGLADLTPGPGVSVLRAESGHPCAGVWLALADLLNDGVPAGTRVLLADRDPRLPYTCSLPLTTSAVIATTAAAAAAGRSPGSEVTR